MRRTLMGRREALRQSRGSGSSGSRLVLPCIAVACFLLYLQLSGGGGGGAASVDAAAASSSSHRRGGNGAAVASSSLKLHASSSSSSQRRNHPHHDRKIAAGAKSASTSLRSSMAASDAAAAALRARLRAQATSSSSSSASAAASSSGGAAGALASAAGAGAAVAAVRAQQPLAAAGGADEVVRRAAADAAEAVAAEARATVAAKAKAAASVRAADGVSFLQHPSADTAASAASYLSSSSAGLPLPIDNGSKKSGVVGASSPVLPAIATDRRAQPLAEPASADAAAEAAFLAATLRDPVDPSPPAGTGAASPDEARRLAVRSAMAHSWAGYVANAWGADELAPVTRHGYETFCSLGATLVDSLDTLWLMGFRKEFDRAKDWIANSLTFKPANGRQCGLSVFESTIRVLGGLLAAHDLSGETAFVSKAEELARALEPAYDTPLFFPRSEIELQSGTARTPQWIGGGQAALLAEIGTVQMELLALSAATGNASWAELGERVIEAVDAAHPPERDGESGLLPIYVSLNDASASGTVTIGAMADSYYEYLLKVWILKGKAKGERYRRMWERSMDAVLDELLATSENGGHVYVGERFGVGGAFNKRMEHLTCFIAGNLALGVMHGAIADPKKAERYMDAAKGITETCYNMYKLMPSGLAPEYVRFDTAPIASTGAPPPPSMVSADNAPYNLLRPETVESLFMLWRATGDRRYREWGWELFQSFEKHCKVPGGGYSGIVDVREASPRKNDRQESFWLAETLKYFYLLFSPESALPLDKFVLNTEAHPLRVLSAEAVGALTSDFGASPAGLGQYVSGVAGGAGGAEGGGGGGGRDALLADVAWKLASSAKSVA